VADQVHARRARHHVADDVVGVGVDDRAGPQRRGRAVAVAVQVGRDDAMRAVERGGERSPLPAARRARMQREDDRLAGRLS
jgi:hypothetical protein